MFQISRNCKPEAVINSQFIDTASNKSKAMLQITNESRNKLNNGRTCDNIQGCDISCDNFNSYFTNIAPSLLNKNAGGIRTKLNDFSLSVNSGVYDVIIISETWLCSNIANEELLLSDYNVFRADRDVNTSNKVRGGGVLIAVKSYIHSSLILTGNSVESIYVHIYHNELNLIVCGVYIPPASPLNVFEDYCCDLESIFEKFTESSYIIVGDFNLPQLRWDLGNIQNNALSGSRDYYNVISYTTAFMNLEQLNKIPNSRNVFLDLVFSNIVSLDISIAIDPIFPASVHHFPYEWCVPSTSLFPVYSETRRFDFAKGNYNLLNNFFASVRWDSIWSGLTIDEMVVINSAQTFPKWFTKELKDLCVMKKSAHYHYKKSGKLEDYLHFKNLRSRCKELSRQLYSAYVSKVNLSISNNPKFFWKFIRDKRNNDMIPNEMCLNQEVAKGGKQIPDLFAKYFSSVYVKDDSRKFLCDFEVPLQVNDNGLSVTLSIVFEHISALYLSCNSGPDGIPSVVLKNCNYTLSLPLFILFKTSLNLGIFPHAWKNSYIIPVFKSGQRQRIDDYRGVCNQSVDPKLLDNFAKAFDRVNHRLLILKLRKLGFTDLTISWLTSFLTDRKQQVRIGKYISDHFDVSSGVPQEIKDLGIADACVLHGIINGYIDNPDLLAKLSFVVPAVDSRSTRNLSIFRIPPATTNFSANHPLRRIMEAANGYIKRKEVCLFSSSKVHNNKGNSPTTRKTLQVEASEEYIIWNSSKWQMPYIKFVNDIIYTYIKEQRTQHRTLWYA
ncbi:uncharacterized protein LOC135125696 [Zophobas morio]|uniref:uncharacterized protein LOC135125696 n=1 Tax=Zophobas morio TaxID=2755281 RepID=UPI0030835C60